MKAVIQRVRSASVSVDGRVVGSIGPGLMILLGVGIGDGEKEVRWLADKTANLRIFEDEDEKMNLSLLDVGGEALVVSQFTLLGDCKKGRRPGFDKAAAPELAEKLYNDFVVSASVWRRRTDRAVPGQNALLY
jgi:D-tyrosyl-tRNA(Tyr) deacylase